MVYPATFASVSESASKWQVVGREKRAAPPRRKSFRSINATAAT